LVIEADESDGSIAFYTPYIGLLLNIEKDHKEIDELQQLFNTFKQNSTHFITNVSYSNTAAFASENSTTFSINNAKATYQATAFIQQQFAIQFNVNNDPFLLHTIGKHNMENAVAAIAVANYIGVDFATCAAALQHFKGIYRRNQILGNKHSNWFIDDYAHNPAKVAAAIQSIQPLASKIVAWFQPHGYAPTRFLKNEFITQIASVLREEDVIIMSEIYYAGGTAIKDISANDLVEGIKQHNKNALFVSDRNNLLDVLHSFHLHNSAIIFMGARDPSLDNFAQHVFLNY
jgi:UDP-N-acetylmuramate--alanine ligase